MSEYVGLGDLVRFGITVHSPSGFPILINADETPRWFAYRNNSDIITLQNNFIARSNLIGTYLGSGIFSTGNGFSTGDYVEVHASGKVYGLVSRIIVKTFVIDDIYDVNLVRINDSGIVEDSILDVNVVQISGLPVDLAEIVDANVVQVSGIPVTIADDVYFANIKFIKDSVTPKDEYVVQWFKNSLPLESGQITNAALSVYRTNDGTALFENQILSYFNNKHGALRRDETTSANLTPSGEPVLAVTSGTIDSSMRTWKNCVGIDYL